MDEIMMPIVSMEVARLTDNELRSMLLAVQLGTDPRGVLGYTKLAGLFDQEEGRAMDESTRRCFIRLASARLKASWKPQA